MLRFLRFSLSFRIVRGLFVLISMVLCGDFSASRSLDSSPFDMLCTFIFKDLWLVKVAIYLEGIMKFCWRVVYNLDKSATYFISWPWGIENSLLFVKLKRCLLVSADLSNLAKLLSSKTCSYSWECFLGCCSLADARKFPLVCLFFSLGQYLVLSSIFLSS